MREVRKQESGAGSQKPEVKRAAGRFRAAVFLVFALCTLQAASSNEAHAMLTAKANHDHITIDFFYHGSTVGVKGMSTAGRDLVITITSPEGRQTLKRKGKVGGVLWMNTGTLTFENTPNFYEVFSTREISAILSPAEQQKHVIGYDALRKHVLIEPITGEEEKARWFGEFVKFKEASRLYAAQAGTIERKTAAGGHEEYSIGTTWPYQAAPGEYTVSVYAVKNGKVVERAETRVRVEQVGLVKTLASMASDRAALYGFLSIGIALGAGFGVGMIFRKGGGAH